MTEEMSPEFEMFSQMLDEESEQNIPEEFQADAELLSELGKSLRESDSSGLPSDFAQETANIVRSRYAGLPPVRRLLDASRTHLLGKALSKKNVWKSLLLASPLLAVALEPQLLLMYGALLGFLGAAWIGQERALGLAPPTRGSYPRLVTGLFYLFPILSVLVTGLVTGLGIWGLNSMSLSFKDQDQTGLVFGLTVGTGTFFLLWKGLTPLWKAFRVRAASNLPFLSLFQVVHATVFGTFALALLGQISPTDYTVSQSLDAITENGYTSLGCVVILALVLSIFLNRSISEDPTKPSFARAWKTTLSNLALGFVPIFLALVGFYQLHLTREIQHESYEYIAADVAAWEKEQLSIPSQSNGWLEIRPYFIRTEQKKNPENLKLTKTIRKFSNYYDPPEDWMKKNGQRYQKLFAFQRDTDRQKAQRDYEKARENFLEILSTIESVLNKPHFSTLPTEGFSLQSQVPDFISYRAFSQNLSTLTQEALEAEQYDKALEYMMLSFRWGSKGESGSLIDMMIRVSMLSISAENVERVVLSGKLGEDQLRSLANALEASRPNPTDFSDAMKRETVVCERAFHNIASGKWSLADIDDIGALGFFSRVLPKSYWESERKAYLNYQLTRSDSWMTLAFQSQSTDVDEEINPFNLASLALVPNYGRAQAQFCKLTSQYSALILMTHLERYYLKHGDYPSTLEALLGEYVDELPEDIIDPRMRGKKKGFDYDLTQDGYTLTSSSQVYTTIDLKTKQVYGYDGHFGPR